jgi:hypothetical protein
MQRPHGTSRTVGSIVRRFKIGVTKQIGRSIWQRNYYEHIIRDDEYLIPMFGNDLTVRRIIRFHIRFPLPVNFNA